MMELKVTEYDGLTKELIEREPTADEIADIEARQAKFAAIKAEAEAKAEAKAALLERLGITADEAKLLLA
jgi:hypothetical protein